MVCGQDCLVQGYIRIEIHAPLTPSSTIRYQPLPKHKCPTLELPLDRLHDPCAQLTRTFANLYRLGSSLTKTSKTQRLGGIASNSNLNNMGYVSKTTLVDRSLHVDKKHLAFMTQSLGTIAPRVLERPLLFNEADVV